MEKAITVPVRSASKYTTNSTTSKRQKLLKGPSNGETIDRISNLPDEILCLILSFLPTLYSVKTSILSRRWRNLWSSVTTLEFDYRISSSYTVFNDSVNRMLIHRYNKPILHKFSLYCHISDAFLDYPRFCSWICEVIELKVEHLDLRINSNEKPIDLPQSLYLSETLVVLKVRADLKLINHKISIFLPSLKILCLTYTNYIDNESASRLFASCPVLEELIIWKKLNKDEQNWNVSVPKLKRFTLRYYNKCDLRGVDSKYKVRVRVFAPSLEYVYTEHGDIVFDNSTSLVEANLSVDIQASKITQLIKIMSNVKRLSMSYSSIRSLVRATDNDLPMFHNLIRLELSFDSNGCRLLPQILENASNLKVLVLDMGFWFEHLSPCWRWPDSVPNCLLSCFESIEIRGWNGLPYIKNLLIYFLKNAKVLKKMKIQHSSWENKWNLLKYLLMFPKASKECQIQLFYKFLA